MTKTILSPEDQARWDAFREKVKRYQAQGCKLNFSEEMLESVVKYHDTVDVITEFDEIVEMCWKQYTQVPF